MHHGQGPADFLGWMLVVNIAFFLIGLAKVTLFKGMSGGLMTRLFGDRADAAMASVYTALWTYWILILVFNLVPFLTLRLVGWQ